MKQIIGVILAGGGGKRFKGNIPKQFFSLNGKKVIDYSIDCFLESNLFQKIIVVIDKKYKQEINSKCKVILGGETRNESIYNAIKACPKDTDYIFFHDAARPFLKSIDILKYIKALKKYDAAITSQFITDALFYAKREDYKLIQTPEAFRFAKLKKQFRKESKAIGIYEQIMPCKIKFIELPHINFKITIPQDIYIAEQLMKYQDITKRIPEIKNKRILILGGTGGIGRAIVKELKKQKANFTAIGSKQLDLSKNNIILPDYLTKEKWDCIINSSGAYCKDSEGMLINYDKIMNVNFRSNVYLIENAPKLIKPNGSIVCIGSTAATKGRAGIALYSASKAALNTLVEGTYEILKKHNIHINVICPAKVATKLQKHINPNADFTKMISPSDLAKIIVGYIDINKTGEIVYIRVGQEK